MKILLFADLHQFNKEDINQINENDFDIIVFLGDIKASVIKYILDCFAKKKSYGVLGNHDDKNVFFSINQQLKIEEELSGRKRENIIDINLKKVIIKEVSFVGIQGVNKYKNNMIGYTDEELENVSIPDSVNILFSHDSGYCDLKDVKNDNAHIGMKKISEYRVKSKPTYHIFGHYHIDCSFQKDNVTCFCIYGCSIFDTELGKIEKVF